MSERPPILITWRGVRDGIALSGPLLPGIVVFGLSFGAVAQKAGLGLFEACFMSAIVYAGASQLVAVGAWQSHWTLIGAATVILLVTVVNARLILMGVALRPWLQPLGPASAYALLGFNTDASWLILLRAEAEGRRRDLGLYLGVTLLWWPLWLGATIPGWLLGAAIADPKRYGLDLVQLVFFTIFLVPLWRGPRQARPWLAAAVAAVLVQALVPGQLYILAGSFAGAIAGALLDD